MGCTEKDAPMAHIFASTFDLDFQSLWSYGYDQHTHTNKFRSKVSWFQGQRRWKQTDGERDATNHITFPTNTIDNEVGEDKLPASLVDEEANLKLYHPNCEIGV